MVAATPPIQAPSLSEVVVHAGRLPDAAGDAAFSVLVIAPEELRDRATLDDGLKSAAGFSLFRRTSTLGANPTTQGVSLRAIAGSGASRALVTLDGVPQNDPFRWLGDLERFAARHHRRRAPGARRGRRPLRRGRPDRAGAARQRDRPARREALSASAGELGYRQEAGAIGAEAGGVKLLLGAAGQESDGWIPVRAGRGAADRPLDLHAWSGSARVERDIGAVALSSRGWPPTRRIGARGR